MSQKVICTEICFGLLEGVLQPPQEGNIVGYYGMCVISNILVVNWQEICIGDTALGRLQQLKNREFQGSFK